MANHKPENGSHFLPLMGEIPSEAYSKLVEHLNECSSCRSLYTHFDEVMENGLSVETADSRPGWFSRLFSRRNPHKDRFVAAAQERGIHFSEAATGMGSAPRVALFTALVRHAKFALVTIVLLGAVGVLGYELRESRNQNAAFAQARTGLTAANANLQQQTALLSDAKRALEAEVAEARQDYSLAAFRSHQLEEELQRVSLEVDSLKATLGHDAEEKGSLRAQLHDAKQRVKQLLAEIKQVRIAQQATGARMASQQARISQLSGQLSRYTQQVYRAERLLAADRDIRELMTARNLHIVDVFDVDPIGETRQPFGRVFYTQGRSLIFYAYDLDTTQFSEADYSFQAWGVREPGTHSAQSLGVFYMDDKADRRWVLRFEDPQVLGLIDAVFVTAERSGGAAKPTGEKLLYAYLKNRPNHP